MATNNPPLEFLTTTRIGEKGQLTVPKQFREELGRLSPSCASGMASYSCRNSSVSRNCASASPPS
jgi:hypothetical protein